MEQGKHGITAEVVKMAGDIISCPKLFVKAGIEAFVIGDNDEGAARLEKRFKFGNGFVKPVYMFKHMPEGDDIKR